MLHLRRCILTRLLSSPATSPVSPLHRLLSITAPAISPNPSFAAEEYLVDTCGLTRAQALKASTKLTHLKSPSNSDAVRAFLADLGLSSADVAALVAKDPKFLCTGVGRTLAPTAVDLTGLGLSHTEIARLVPLAPTKFRRRSIVSNLSYYLFLFGSYENLLRVLKRCSKLLSSNLERVVKPNVALLRECGLSACDITRLCTTVTWLLTINPERLLVTVACAEGLGVPHGSAMFKHALKAAAYLSEEKIAARVDYLKKTFSWSDADVGIAVSKSPTLLLRSEDIQQRRSEFLISEVGLEPSYIAHRPSMLSYSLEGRLRPRYYVVKFLKENGLLDHDRDYYAAVMRADKGFLDKYIHPYMEAAPHLAEDYAAACRGELPTRFIFT